MATGCEMTVTEGVDDPDACKPNQSWPEAEINLMARCNICSDFKHYLLGELSDPRPG